MVETCDTFFAQLAPRLKAEIVREIKRLEVVLEMISTVEAERDAILTERNRRISTPTRSKCLPS